MVVRVVKYLVTHVSERAYREAQPTINGKPSQRGAADGYRDLGRPHGPFSPTGPAWISIVGPGSSSPFGETNTIWITCGGPVGITSASSRSSRRDRFRSIIRAPHRLCAALLKRPGGAKLQQIMAATEWQPH